MPKSSPFATFGHDTFSSIASTPSSRRERGAEVLEVLDRLAGDVHDARGREAPERGQHVADESLEPRVLDADRVQHPGGRLDDARRRVPLAPRGRDALRDDAADPREVDDVRRFDPAAEGPRGDEDGILEGERPDRDLERASRRGPLRRGRRVRASRSAKYRRSSGAPIVIIESARLKTGNGHPQKISRTKSRTLAARRREDVVVEVAERARDHERERDVRPPRHPRPGPIDADQHERENPADRDPDPTIDALEEAPGHPGVAHVVKVEEPLDDDDLAPRPFSSARRTRRASSRGRARRRATTIARKVSFFVDIRLPDRRFAGPAAFAARSRSRPAARAARGPLPPEGRASAPRRPRRGLRNSARASTSTAAARSAGVVVRGFWFASAMTERGILTRQRAPLTERRARPYPDREGGGREGVDQAVPRGPAHRARGVAEHARRLRA